MDKKIKLIGRVVHETKEELEERLQRRRDWLRGYIGGE